MDASIRQGRASHQDQSGATSVVPGADLMATIAAAYENERRPGLTIGVMPEEVRPGGVDLVVPVAKAFRLDGDGRIAIFPQLPPLWEAGFCDDLILAIETRHPIALERLQVEGSRARSDSNALYLAALHDIAGVPWKDLAAYPLPGGFEFSDETAAGRAGRRGRKMWRAIGAWPWFHFADGPTPPLSWTSAGANGWLLKSFEIWRTGRI